MEDGYIKKELNDVLIHRQ